jgi:Putative transmembrane protein (Alph_Pro_TM)
VKTSAYIIRLLLVGSCLVIILASSVLALVECQGLAIEPRRLPITESFHGGRVSVSAEIPKGSQAVLEFKGPAHPTELVLKGRRWGLWMSVGELTVDHAPSLYLVTSTDPKLASKKGPEDRWGYGALREQVKFSGKIPKAGEAFLFEQFLKLKESQGLYGIFPGALKVVDTHGQVVRVEGHFTLPGNIRPETYQVNLCVLNNGKIVERRSAEFPVEMKRLAAFLVTLAYQHGTLYGLLAVFTAMATGFLMGHLFKSKRAH